MGLAVSLWSCQTAQKENRLPYYNQADFTPQFLSPSEALTQIDHTIGEFSFTDQHGATVTDQDIEGKIHVANFVFTSCISICPVMTKHLKILQEQFADNPQVEVLSYSVTPWIDTVDRLEGYTQQNGITAKNWHFLTGNQAAIYALARRSYFAEEDLGFTKDSSDFLHTEHVLLVDGSKRIRGIYNGTLELEIQQLAKDISWLLAEAKKP